ncbi:LOW QUALITY PROTEIN: WD repeat-containing protein 88 [Erethizon dorsatum]
MSLSVLPPGPSPAPRAWRPRRASHVTLPPSRSGSDRAGGGGWGGPGARAPPRGATQLRARSPSPARGPRWRGSGVLVGGSASRAAGEAAARSPGREARGSEGPARVAGCGCHRPAPGPGAATGIRDGLAVRLPKASGEDPQGILAVPSREHWLRRLPWASAAKAVGRFKMSLRALRRDRLLASLDPLVLNKGPPPSAQHAMLPQALWGDQKPLSKIPFKILSGHERVVSSCHFCVNDTKLLSGSYDCIVKVWWKIRHDTLVVSCKFSFDGKYLISGFDTDHGICIMFAENITTMTYIEGHHRRSIMACCFDPDSQRVAPVLDRCVKIWDVTSQATQLTITRAHDGAISNSCFTFSGHFLCTASWDKTLKIWNIHTGDFRNHGTCVTLMRGHEGSVSSCCFARDSSFLVPRGFDKTVAIWDVAEGYRKLSLKIQMPASDRSELDRPMCGCTMNFFLINGLLFTLFKDRTMRLWNIEEIEQIPLVIKYKKTMMGLKVKQCKGCDRSFSTFESDGSSEIFTKCVFCRREARDSPLETSSSSEEESKD